MDIFLTLLTAVLSAAAMFVLTKIIGSRQLSEMTVFDYINGITVGSVAAELAVAKGEEFAHLLVALAVFGGVTVLFAVVTTKSMKARKLLTGTPALLYYHGKIFKESLASEKVDIDEFLMLLRNQGYFDLAQLEAVMLEANGKLSVLPKAEYRPATPADASVAVPRDELPFNVIVDGHVSNPTLAALGYDEKWLSAELGRQRAGRAKDIFLATLTESGTLSVYHDGTPPEIAKHLE